MHLHRLGEANVTDSSGDGTDRKNNENKEEWVGVQAKLNRQLI